MLGGQLTRRQVFKGGIATIVFAPIAYGVSLAIGGYEAISGLRFLSSKEARIVLALAEAVVPVPNGFEFSSFETIVTSVDDFMEASSLTSRRRLRMFIFGIEHLLPMRFFYWRKFSRLSVEERRELLETLENSRSVPLRAMFRGAKSLVYLGMYDQTQVQQAIGFKEKCRT